MPVYEAAARKALVVALAVLAVLVVLVVFLKPPSASPTDPTRAPQWLKDVCYVRGDLRRPWRKIVIHHSGGSSGDLALIDHYHRTDPKRLYESAGYHFVIGNGSKSGDGEIEVGSRWHRQKDGAHCLGHNHEAIGICLIGNFELEGQSSIRSVPYVRSVLLHREVKNASTVCPGKNFPTELFRDLLNAQIELYRPEEGPEAKESRSLPPRDCGMGGLSTHANAQ